MKTAHHHADGLPEPQSPIYRAAMLIASHVDQEARRLCEQYPEAAPRIRAIRDRFYDEMLRGFKHSKA